MLHFLSKLFCVLIPIVLFKFFSVWKSSTVPCICGNYLWSGTDSYAASGKRKAVWYFILCFLNLVVCFFWFKDYSQGVDHFKKIMYTEGITYGELFLENEYACRGISSFSSITLAISVRFSFAFDAAKSVLDIIVC